MLVAHIGIHVMEKHRLLLRICKILQLFYSFSLKVQMQQFVQPQLFFLFLFFIYLRIYFFVQPKL